MESEEGKLLKILVQKQECLLFGRKR